MTLETPSALIARLQGLIHESLKDLLTGIEPYALVDFPDIRNVGDSAIWLGEMGYLAAKGLPAPSYVSRIQDFSAEKMERAVPSGPIFIHGGGNFGDIWEPHQDFRERILERWPDRLVVQLPQSIHYNSTQRAEQTARVIARHKRFVILARDQESHDFATKHFDCETRLCPDMAFWIGRVQPNDPIFPILAMLRADKEKGTAYDLSAFDTVPVEDWITEPKRRVQMIKLLAILKGKLQFHDEQTVRLAKFNAAANERFSRGVRQLSRGRALVTDRLHVHIVSLLLGRPHATLDNNYGKVTRFMAAFSGNSPLSYRASSMGDAMQWAAAQAGSA